jgi:hypothetical protein
MDQVTVFIPSLSLIVRCSRVQFYSSAKTFSVSVLLGQLKTENPIVLLSPTLSSKVLTNLIPARTFKVPTNVDIHTETATGTGGLAIYHSGEQVNHVIETDTSFSASYLGITVSGSASYSYKSQYTDDQQYAFMSSSVTAYASELKAVASSLNPSVKKVPLTLPQWSQDFKVVQAYFKFFR